MAVLRGPIFGHVNLVLTLARLNLFDTSTKGYEREDFKRFEDTYAIQRVS